MMNAQLMNMPVNKSAEIRMVHTYVHVIMDTVCRMIREAVKVHAVATACLPVHAIVIFPI